MATVIQLREQAKSYGLRGYSTLRKPGLIRLIAEARAPVFRARAARSRNTGRYPALTRGDVDNPHKKAQRIRELRQLDNEVTAALRANKRTDHQSPTQTAAETTEAAFPPTQMANSPLGRQRATC